MRGDYERLPDAERTTVSGRRFFVYVSGKTNGCHQEWIRNLKDIGHHEASSPENSDYLLVFCPIISRVGTDIGAALERVSGGKPIILVVMHHTSDSEFVLSESRRQVENPDVYVTVDCLFFEDKLLWCDRNDQAWTEICKTLGVPQNGFRNWLWNPQRIVIAAGSVVIVAVIVITVAVVVYLQKKKN